MNTESRLPSRASLTSLGLITLLGCVSSASAQDAKPVAPTAAHSHHVLRTFDVGGDGGWDYLTMDSDSHRLFVSRSTHVMVIDTETGKVVGDIPDTDGVH